MRRRVLTTLLLAVLAVPVFGGDIQVPGKTDPPPPPPACTENCTNSATTADDSASLIDAILDALHLALTMTP